MVWFKRHGHWLLTAFVAFVFIQSLFFKFTGSPETVYIFQGKLDPWAASLGFPGVFAPGGIFSAKVVGSFELIASILLILGAAMSRQRAVQMLGAAMGMGVISGAIFFTCSRRWASPSSIPTAAVTGANCLRSPVACG